jgi:hypothetical protein
MAEKDKKLGVCEIAWVWEDRITHDFWVENLIFMTAFVVWKKF